MIRIDSIWTESGIKKNTAPKYSNDYKRVKKVKDNREFEDKMKDFIKRTGEYQMNLKDSGKPYDASIIEQYERLFNNNKKEK